MVVVEVVVVMNVAALVQRGAHSVPPPLSKLPCSDLLKRQLLLLLFRSAPANANASSSFCTDLHTVAQKVQSALHCTHHFVLHLAMSLLLPLLLMSGFVVLVVMAMVTCNGQQRGHELRACATMFAGGNPHQQTLTGWVLIELLHC